MPVAKDGLHVIDGILVEARLVDGRTLVARASDLKVLLALDALLVIFGVVVLDEVVKFVCGGPVARAAVTLVFPVVLVVREDLGEAVSVATAILFTVAALESFKFCGLMCEG